MYRISQRWKELHGLRRSMAASGNELGALALPGGPGVLLATQANADPLGPVMTDGNFRKGFYFFWNY